MSCSKNFDLTKPGSLETTCELNTYLKIQEEMAASWKCLNWVVVLISCKGKT